MRANLDAIKLLKQLEAENRNPTPEEKATLAKYTGWGGLKEVFDEGKAAYRDRPPWSEEQKKEAANWEKSWGKHYDDLNALLTPEEHAAARGSILNAHYTAREVVQGMWTAMARLGFSKGLALEPAAGVGNFLGLGPTGARWRAVELDSVSGRILGKLYPQAHVQVTGFQDASIPANSQDLVISNFPFAADGPLDKRYPKLSLHNYFFARALDLVKPGGIVAAITSDSTMDSAASRKAREYMAERADLVGAIRLPNNAFKKNAGTEVTTDIIFLRKKDGTPFAGQPFTRTAEVPISRGEPVNINEYFAAHPEMMLGRMSREGTMYQADQQALVATPGELGPKLAAAIATLPQNVLGATTTAEAIARPVIKAEAGSKLGTLVYQDGGIYLVQGDGTLEKPDWAGTPAKVAQAKRYIELRALGMAAVSEMNDPNVGDKEIELTRQHLNRLYDDYVKRHGPLNGRASEFLDDDGDYPFALSLEDGSTKLVRTIRKGKETDQRVVTWIKSKIFSERTIFPRLAPITADTVADGLEISQNFAGKVDPEYIATLTGKSLEAVKNELTATATAFENPASGQWEDRSTYLSGYVKEKLKQARIAAADHPFYLKNVAELEKVQPAPRPINKIGVTLGSTWVPPAVIEEFIKDRLEMESRVSHTAETGNWHVTALAGQWNERNKTTYGVHGWKGHELVERSLNLKNATVTMKVGDSEVRDPVASAEAQAKQELLQAEFKKFVLSTPAVANTLAQIYNEQFNGVVRPKFDGPVWAHYPGASTDITLREHQKDCVTRALRNSVGLFHAVGTGKTFIMATTAMEARRLKTARKPMLVVQNATVEQTARAFKRLYPAARLLVPNAKQRNAENRNKLLSRVATGDWDCVIIPQSFANMLPDDPQRVRQWITDRIEEMEAARIAEAAKSGGRSPKASDLVKAIKKLKERLEDLAKRKVDNVLTFEQLGVDMLMVDEAHEYKKLEFETQMDNIKGLDMGRSQRALSMLFKVRWVQEKNQGRNVVFATGTPVSNTLAEMWNMMRFVRPDVLTHYGIETFDDFASAFCKTKTATEMTAGGTWKVVTRFNRFTNGPELGNAWRTVADVVTNEEVNLPGLPALKNGKPTMHVIALTPRLKAYIEQLRMELEAFAAMSGKEKRDNSHIPLVVYGKAKKAALDMRMINPELPDEPGSKLNVAADNIMRAYVDSTPVLGTQMVFADSYQNNPDNPQFNLYEELQQKLIERGIPADQIQILTDKIKDARREAVFDKFREGKLRVMIGSTGRMGVGVDVPQHMVALHHLDAPARPMDVEQRNGRLVRQGNQNVEVEQHVYGVENTLDAACYQKLADKQVFTNQAVRGDLPDVDFEDAANEQSLSFEEQMAAFSGDKRAMEKVGLETQVRQLEALRNGHFQQVRQAHETIQNLKAREIPYQEKQIAKSVANAAVYAKAFGTPNQFELKIGERTVEGRKDVAETLDKVFQRGSEMIFKAAQESKKFGDNALGIGFVELNGQKITFEARLFVPADAVVTADQTRIAWDFPEGAGGGTVTTGAGFFTSLSAVLERIAGRPVQEQAALANEERNLRELTGFVTQPFDQEAELEGAKQRLVKLMEEFRMEGEQASKDAQAKIAERKASASAAPASDEIQENMGGGPSRPRKAKAAKPVTVRDIEAPASALMQDINRFRAAVAPQTLGDPARFAADLLRQLSAQMANEMARADERLKPFRNSFDRTPVPKKWKYDPTLPLPRNLAFIAAYEGGDAATLGPTEAKAAAEFARQNEDWLARVQALGTGALQTVIENYFPHLWANPAHAKQVMAQFLRKNPLMGNKSFLKQRTHALFIHGLAAGLRPVHDNPVDLWLLKKREVERFILGNTFVHVMRNAGLMKFVHVFSKPPEGYSTVNDAAFQQYGPPTVTISEAFDAGMREATLDVLKSLGVPLERLAKIGGMGRWGYATHHEGQTGNEKITTKFGGPDWVIWHELGHVLDNRYPELRTLLTATESMETELRALADLRLDEDPSTHEKRYVRTMPEKMAVVLQAYLHAPDRMAEVAPTIKTAFASFLEAHPELSKINDIRPSLRLGSDTAEQNVGGLVKLGNYYMPDAAARVMNNYLSPGLNPHLWYRSLRSVSNLMNGVQLGFSAFHLGFTSLDAATSRLAVGIEDAVGGRLGSAVRTAISVPVSPVTNIVQGARLRAAVLKGDITDPELQALVSALEAGGGRIGQDQFWKTEFTRRMYRAFHQGTATGYLSGTIQLPFALFEQTLRPIMEYVVPRQKLGVFADLAKREMLKLGDEATPADVRAAMRKAWDSVDNRMGQLVYDNMFYNRAVKDIALLTFRAYGWQLGKYREGLGAVYDAAQAAKSTFRGERPEFTHRMAYAMALPILVGIIGGLLTYLLTGEKPKGKDYFMPRFGGKDGNGNDLRVNLPSYMKDVISYWKHPVTSLWHSLNPMISGMYDLLQNKDFYDVRIRNPDDPIWRQGGEVAEFAAKQFVPFSVAGRQKLADDAAPAWKQIAPFFGITPVPSRITMTPAQELAAEITAAAMPKEPRTQEQFEKSKTIKDVVKAIKAGNQPQAVDMLRGGLQKGILNEQAAQTILERLQYNPLQFQVHNMTAVAAMRVWRVASPDEQTQLKPIIAAKVINSKTLDPKLAAGYLDELKSPLK